MTKAPKALLVALIIGLLYAGVSFWKVSRNHYDDLPFDRSAWLAGAGNHRPENLRGKMIEDLEKRLLKEGMTREQVVRLLGEPEKRNKRSYQYEIGNWGGCPLCPEALEVRFDRSGHLSLTKIAER